MADGGLATVGTQKGDPVEVLKSAAGLLLGVFTSAVGIIGINAGEASTILRNDEWRVLIVLLCLFGALVLAFLSAILAKGARWHLWGMIGGLLVVACGYASFFVVIPLDQTNPWTPSRVAGIVVAATFFGVALVLLALGWRDWRETVEPARARAAAERQKAAELRESAAMEERTRAAADAMSLTAGLDAAARGAALNQVIDREKARNDLLEQAHGRDVEAWNAEEAIRSKAVDVRSWLIVFSGLLLGLAVFGAIRLEARNQQSGRVQVTASVQSPSTGLSEVTVHVVGPRLRNADSIRLTVDGVDGPSGTSDEIEVSTVHPDASGVAKGEFALPVSLDEFTRLTGTATDVMTKSKASFCITLPSTARLPPGSSC